MQGIQSLMPGQAQQAPMPMPQQSSSTPGAVTGSLKNMPMEQLKMLFLNPQPGSPPLWAVISALAEKQKEAQAIQAAMGQGAMAQNAQMQQQPPVAAQVVQAAEQGGIMQGYAGGGAVAFDAGTGPLGLPQENPEEDLSDDPSLSLRERMVRAEKRRALSRQQGVGRSFAERFPAPVESTTDTGDERPRMLLRAPAPAPVMSPEAQALMSKQGPRGIMASPRATPTVQPQQRQQRQEAAQAAPAPAEPGIAGLMGPMIEPERLAMRGAVDERQAAIRNAAKTPEDVLKARGGIDALMKEIVDARRAEEQRLMTHSDKRLEEARARAAQSPLSDITFLGQMLEGMRGTKRFGDALAGAASGAGKAQTARSQALQAAEEKYDLSRRDIFNLANLRQQVQLDQAKLAEARATGDADRANKAALDLAQSKEALAKFEMEVSNKSREFGLEERKLAQQGQIAREQMANALKVAGMQADRTPAEVRLMEWLRDPKNKKLYEEIQASKRAEDRNLKLYEIYVKNKLLLGDMSFEDFAAGLKDASGATGAGAGEFKVLSSRPKQ